jgi:hypothetical protein
MQPSVPGALSLDANEPIAASASASDDNRSTTLTTTRRCRARAIPAASATRAARRTSGLSAALSLT